MEKFSRRSFLKCSLGTIIAGKVVNFNEAKALVTETDFGIEKKVPFMCRMCDQFCPSIGIVRDGRLVRIESNKNTPYPGVCGRSRAAVGALYSPDRVKTPLIRTGKRGEGKFRRANWDEALDIIGKKLRKLRSEENVKAVAYIPRFNSAPGIDKEFFKIYGTPNIISYGDTCWAGGTSLGLAAIVGGPKLNGVPVLGPGAVSSDYENAEYGLLIGRNPGGGIVTYSWGVTFGRGKRNGLKVTTVDPRKPSEAGESDSEWIPIKPGTDPAFLLGLLNTIISRKYYDEDYIQRYTNADMLIDIQTKLPVETRKYHKVLDYLVYNEEQKGFTFKSEAETTSIYGNLEVILNGENKKCKPAFQFIADEVMKYTPEWAERICTVPASNIVSIAENLNKHKPKIFIDRGYRSERYANSLREKLLITMLNLLLGSFGQEGGIFWQRPTALRKFIRPPKPKDKPIIDYYMENDPGWSMANRVEWRRTYIKSIIEEKPYLSKVAVIHGQNVVGGSSGSVEIAEALKKLELIVVISPFFDETTMYADIILPDATYMERDEALSTKFKAPIPTIGVNRKAVEPLFESKDGYWIYTELARKVLNKNEFSKYFSEVEARGVPAIWEKQFTKFYGLTKAERKTIPSLKVFLEKGVWTGKKKYKIKALGTPTGKLELYSLFLANKHDQLKKTGYRLAEYASPLPTWNAPYYFNIKDGLNDGEFIPITAFSALNTFTGAQTRNNELIKFFAEVLDLDKVFVNKNKGQRLGLKDHDIVEIINIEKPDVKCIAILRLSELVHPDALFSYYGYGAGFLNRCRDFLRYSVKYGFSPNHLASLRFNPLTAGHPCQDFIVKIRKLT